VARDAGVNQLYVAGTTPADEVCTLHHYVMRSGIGPVGDHEPSHGHLVGQGGPGFLQHHLTTMRSLLCRAVMSSELPAFLSGTPLSNKEPVDKEGGEPEHDGRPQGERHCSIHVCASFRLESIPPRGVQHNDTERCLPQGKRCAASSSRAARVSGDPFRDSGDWGLASLGVYRATFVPVETVQSALTRVQQPRRSRLQEPSSCRWPSG
jgi:hypothetical protein